jgi:hypothetical protein
VEPKKGKRRGPKQPVKKKRRTATEIEKEEAAKRLQKETNYVPELMVRWRCTGKYCPNEGKACLRLAKEDFCRPLRADTLAAWNQEIKAGRATVNSFPLQISLPLPESGYREKSIKKNSRETPPAPPAPQPIVISWAGPSPSTPTRFVDRVRTQHETQQTPTVLSSPVRHDPVLSSEELLNKYFEWFTARAVTGLEGTARGDLETKIREVHRVLQEEFYDLGGVQRMTAEGWDRLGIKIGLGDRLRRGVSEFERMRRGV